MAAGVRAAPLFCYGGQSLPNRPVEAPFPSFVAQSFPGVLHRTSAEHVGGTTWTQRAVDAASREDARYLSATAGPKVFIDTSGTTDVELLSDAPTIIANAQAYWAARRAAGWDFIIATTVPDSSIFDGTEDALRAAVNDAIEDSVDPGVMLDAFVDWRLVPEFENHLSGAFALELGEYTHFTAEAAEDLAAPPVVAVLQALPL